MASREIEKSCNFSAGICDGDAGRLVIVRVRLTVPVPSFYKSYQMTDVDIDAVIDESGCLHVEEARTFVFDGPFTCVWWEFDSFGTDAYMTVDSVKLEQGGSVRELEPTEFNGKWRAEGGQGFECYSLDMKSVNTLNVGGTAIAKERMEFDPSYTSYQRKTKTVKSTRGIYVLSEWTDEQIRVTISYHVDRMLSLGSDEDVLYWKFVGSRWQEPSQNVDFTLNLPVPEGGSAAGVSAWGTGAEKNLLSVSEPATVTGFLGTVPPGYYAEIRCMFPAMWLNDKRAAVEDLKPLADQTRASAEKEALVEYSPKSKTSSVKTINPFYQTALPIAFLVVACVLVLACVFERVWRKRCEESLVAFKHNYWTDVPDPAIHPLVFKVLEDRGVGKARQYFFAEVLHLISLGILDLETDGPDGPALVKNADRALVENEIDRRALSILFGIIGKADHRLTISQIQSEGGESTTAR